jgi:hypothetical protein
VRASERLSRTESGRSGGRPVEAWLAKAPWTSATMDGHRLTAMLNAIVGIVVERETVQAQAKLGRHNGAPAGRDASLRCRHVAEADM